LKKALKKYLPKTLKSLIINHANNQTIKNHFKKNYSKNALLSYILTPFQQDSLAHTNFYEAQSWAKILDELGYNVDIIDFRNTKKIDLSKYDLICGFGDVFQQYFESGINKKIITIYYSTGMHVCHQNQASLSRVKDVYRKKGVWLAKSARFVEKTWTHQTALVDGIIALGNEVCANSYRKYFNGSVYSLPAPFYKTIDAETIIKQKTEESKKHYLWFGSSGLVHKGLDLCLEYFAKNQDLYLHVCGPIENESNFVTTYNKELFKTPNIQVYGFVDIASSEFENILSKCSFTIFPSCSEGGSPSTLTVVGNGGLVPVITKETTIETGSEIWIDALNYEKINKAIRYSQNLSFEEIKELQYKNIDFVKNNHTQEIYYEQLMKNIQNILGQINDL
jgi:glycosyltransferase involved in cell wall biosynthesis